MPAPLPGAIDCDVHVAVPQTRTLVPYLDDYWADHVRVRGVDTQLDRGLTEVQRLMVQHPAPQRDFGSIPDRSRKAFEKREP